MKIRLKSIVKDIPFFILLINGISIWIISGSEPIDYSSPDADKQYIQHMNDYNWVYSLLSEFSGFSIPVIVFMAFYAYLHRYCLYSWVCIIGLGLLNILNIIYFFVPFRYIQIYSGLIILPCLIFAIIKWKSTRYYKDY